MVILWIIFLFNYCKCYKNINQQLSVHLVQNDYSNINSKSQFFKFISQHYPLRGIKRVNVENINNTYAPELKIPKVTNQRVETCNNTKNTQRINYASSEIGSVLIASSKGSKGCYNLLNEDKDLYCKMPTNDEKFVIVALSETIKINVIEIANYESYSSSVERFSVYGTSESTNEWNFISEFKAQNFRTEQYFAVESQQWFRFLKFTFNSQYGNDIWTLSNIKIYGSNSLEKCSDGSSGNFNTINELLVEEDLHNSSFPFHTKFLDKLQKLDYNISLFSSHMFNDINRYSFICENLWIELNRINEIVTRNDLSLEKSFHKVDELCFLMYLFLIFTIFSIFLFIIR